MEKIMIFSLFLVLVGLCQTALSSNLDEEHYNEGDKDLIAQKMITAAAKLKDIRTYCREDGYPDSYRLDEIANQLDSELSHLLDQISLYSSQGGLLGGLLVASSFIPSPFSPALFYYGGYLTFGSGVGHISNIALKSIKDDINEKELKRILSRIGKLHHNIEVYKVARKGIDSLPAAAKLLIDGEMLLSEEESQKIIRRLHNIEKIVPSILKGEKIDFEELLDLCTNIYEIIDHFDALTIVRETWQEVKGQIYELKKGSTNAVGLFKGLKSAISSELKSVLGGSLHLLGSKSSGLWSNVFSGTLSVWNIYNEAENIDSTKGHIRNKKALIRELRAIARNVRQICDGLDSCSN
ncbi:uncharacterized protein [Apostichopus japonicus]|uniref:uncharacterized protein isoform X2 n=1 Tax=Stichopus japonicus TaxID=307972 RepID=UPI003AB3E6AA